MLVARASSTCAGGAASPQAATPMKVPTMRGRRREDIETSSSHGWSKTARRARPRWIGGSGQARKQNKHGGGRGWRGRALLQARNLRSERLWKVAGRRSALKRFPNSPECKGRSHYAHRPRQLLVTRGGRSATDVQEHLRTERIVDDGAAGQGSKGWIGKPGSNRSRPPNWTCSAPSTRTTPMARAASPVRSGASMSRSSRRDRTILRCGGRRRLRRIRRATREPRVHRREGERGRPRALSVDRRWMLGDGRTRSDLGV